ncbi:MAG: hypothetical protein WBM26_15895, partial [Polyangiales bacterium]
MKRVNVINGALLLIAVLASAGVTAAISKRTLQEQHSGVGTTEDANGEHIPVRDYTRIVSTSTIADQVLIEIIEPVR